MAFTILDTDDLRTALDNQETISVMHTEAKTNLLGEDHEWVLIVEDQKNLRERIGR